MRQIVERFTKAVAPALLAVILAATLSAQSLPETVEAINKASVATRILYVTAHPDDETASLLAYLSRGLYADVAMLRSRAGRAGRMRSARSRTASSE